LAHGFDVATTIFAKSGSLFGVIRNEVGVTELPGGARYAVAVLTRSTLR
jgi:beta-lactamase class A